MQDRWLRTLPMSETVRACRREDVPAIAGMFVRVLLKGGRSASAGLIRYFEEVLLGGGAGEPRSRVFVDARGEVRGFIGIWPRRMLINGRAIEAAAAGSMMVEHPREHPTAGARLLRAFLSGPQDLSFSETANDISQRMWETVGGERLPAASLDWVRVLRPAGFAVAVARNTHAAASLLRPAAAGIDRLMAAAGRALPSAGAAAGLHASEATSAEIAALIPMLSASYQLHPDWRAPELALLLAHAERKERYGDLYRRIVYARSGQPAACYLYYGRRGEIARVLQVLARPEAAGAALDSLFCHAAAVGCVGVRGRADLVLFDALIARRCFLFHSSATVVHARDKALLEEVKGARALLTGLAGESWTRLIGGEFA
jgi:hypothetical protein